MRKGEGHQQARKVDKQRAIAEKVGEIAGNCEKLRTIAELHSAPPPHFEVLTYPFHSLWSLIVNCPYTQLPHFFLTPE